MHYYEANVAVDSSKITKEATQLENQMNEFGIWQVWTMEADKLTKINVGEDDAFAQINDAINDLPNNTCKIKSDDEGNVHVIFIALEAQKRWYFE